MSIKTFGLKAIRRTVLLGLVLVSAVSGLLGWDPPLALAATGTWSPTGSMNSARESQTATLLPTGKVLVVGGIGSSGDLASAELYDPVKGTWSATGSMFYTRVRHTATLLSNGKVLVSGGDLFGVTLVNAELYDPVAGTWAATGSMTNSRQDHTATLLPTGKVLVVGGANYNGPVASAELYDPVKGTWSATGSMADSRAFHTATLLPNGKVLVSGGDPFGGRSIRASAELYDPVKGTWAATGSMTNARNSHTATLLPRGKVLVAGGYSKAYSTLPLPSAELYDPVKGTWAATDSMADSRSRHTATLLSSGQVLVAGGNNGERALASAELYDPVAGAWSTTGSMTMVRSTHSATLLLSGKVLVDGGSNLMGAELYSPAGVPAPSCGLTRSGTDASGHTFIDITVQDTNSGLGLLRVTESQNAKVAVPTFTVGTTLALVVVATKIDQTSTSQVALQVTNVAGQVTNCDPILIEVGRDGPGGAPRAETFHHVTQGESQVTVINGTPGLTRLRLVVNRHVFEVTGLTDGETRLVDVSSVMRRGDNTVTLIARGTREGTATILIADE